MTKKIAANEDEDVFKAAMRGVKPLKATNKQILQPKKKLINRQPLISAVDEKFTTDFILDDRFTTPVRADESLCFARSGVNYKTIRKLQRNEFTIEVQLDLHGLSVDQARLRLQEFIPLCHKSKIRGIHIIHGKGKRAENEYPLLKNKINSWLQQFAEVLAFCSATSKDGGTGAVYVLLKRRL